MEKYQKKLGKIGRIWETERLSIFTFFEDESFYLITYYFSKSTFGKSYLGRKSRYFPAFRTKNGRKSPILGKIVFFWGTFRKFLGKESLHNSTERKIDYEKEEF